MKMDARVLISETNKEKRTFIKLWEFLIFSEYRVRRFPLLSPPGLLQSKTTIPII